MAPVASDGGFVHGEGVEALEAFSATAFAAAVDAAAGRAWARGGKSPWWSVQGRWLARLMRWVGIAVDLQDALRAQLAATLGVAQLLLLDQVRQVLAAPGYRSRGHAVVSVLMALRHDASLADRLVVAGHQAGLWGRPLRWDPEAEQLRALPFRPGRGRGPPVDRIAESASTKGGHGRSVPAPLRSPETE
jgi:hypothetical protein